MANQESLATRVGEGVRPIPATGGQRGRGGSLRMGAWIMRRAPMRSLSVIQSVDPSNQHKIIVSFLGGSAPASSLSDADYPTGGKFTPAQRAAIAALGDCHICFVSSPAPPSLDRASQKAEQLSRDTIKDRVSIHERPKTIDAKSRVTLAARLIGKTAAETISVMLAVFDRIAPTLRKSITFDNDTAFAQHGLLRTMRAMTTWFCDAYASWQKGGVENANGRLRRWLPRHIDIDKVSDEEIQDIVLTANLTPRKCLGIKTTVPGDPQRTWPRRANPVLIDPLHL
jgi:hypothetical protein